MRNPFASILRSLRIFGLRRTLWRLGARVQLLVTHDFLGNGTVRRQIHGSPMLLDLTHKGISRALFLEGTREDLDVRIVKEMIKPGMRILEIGANIGYYLLLEGRLLRGNGAIFAFEPDPRNLPLLRRNIALNRLEGIVTLFPFAVSDKNATASFYQAAFTNLSSLTARNDSDPSIDVKTVAIDDFDGIPERVDFVRMDIEGFEVEAIRGMLKLLGRSDASLLVELHKPVYNADRHFVHVARDLFALGYRVRYLIASGEKAPREIADLGYRPIAVAHDMARSHGLYENVRDDDFLTLLAHPKKLIRSVLMSRRIPA